MIKNFFFVLKVFLALLTTKAFACGSFTHMFIAEKSLDYMENSSLKSLLRQYRDELKLGAMYADVGYLSDKKFLRDLKIGKTPLLSQKEYGEVMHWDPFLAAFKRYLLENFTLPKEEAPRLVAFLMGLATHRVADDIWHNRVDAAPRSEQQNYPFSTCRKTVSNFCYYGMISKIADIEAIPWGDGFESAHTLADRGVEYALLIDKGLTSKYAPRDWEFPLTALTKVFMDPVIQAEIQKITPSQYPLFLSENDFRKDGKAFKKITITGIVFLKNAGALGFLQKLHRMDWLRDNYEKDPDVGLITIEKQVAKFLDSFLDEDFVKGESKL